MNKKILIAGIFVCLAGWLYAQPNEWENPVRYEWNKEKPHTGFALYESAEDARTEDYALLPLRKV